jgi:hypothetical protein
MKNISFINQKVFFKGLIAALPIVFFSCAKTQMASDADKAVVEAYLQPGQHASVKISKQIPVNGDSNTSYALTNLIVTITYNNTAYAMQHTTNGIYTNNTMSVQIGGTYTLSFNYNGLPVSAVTTIPSKPVNYTASVTTFTLPTFSGGGFPTMPDPIKLNWSNITKDYHFVVVKPIEANPTKITNAIGGGRATANSPTQNSSKEIRTPDFSYYGRHVMLLYHVLPEFAALYNTNGTSSQNLTNVPTNVQNALGIFTGITAADSLFVTVQ